ncbi:MAG: hypothetical protein D6715_00045 [Calditrichaeota bacterium]|nr:MAG: hypothetical protein D6715_00045 [Calditrichota bacterium]
MKIIGGPKANPLLNSPLQKPVGKPVDHSRQAEKARHTEANRQEQTPLKGKINIPKDFEPRVGLDAREQAFFEKLYPKARKEIQAYLKQQQKAVPQKGQIIDVKG